MKTAPFWAVADLHTATEAPLDFRVSLEDIVSQSGRLRDGELASYSANGVRFERGDILFGKLRPYLAKYWLADRGGTAGGDIHVYRPRPQVEPRFLAYVVGSRAFVGFAEASSKGTKMPRAEWSAIREFRVPHSGLPTQRRIADYLDRETGEIDAMLAKLDEMAETLGERRQNAIDSSLDGLPTSRFFSVLDLSQTGPFGTQLSAAEYVDDGVPVINPSHICAGRLMPDPGISVTRQKAQELSRHLLRSGDIVLGRKGDVDKAAVVVPEDLPAVCGSDSLLLRPSSEHLPEFIVYFFHSSQCRTTLAGLAVGAAVTGLNQRAIAELRIPDPPLHVQRRIADHLDEVTGRIDAMLEKVAKLKELLTERRAALITEVVTGRKEV